MLSLSPPGSWMHDARLPTSIRAHGTLTQLVEQARELEAARNAVRVGAFSTGIEELDAAVGCVDEAHPVVELVGASATGKSLLCQYATACALIATQVHEPAAEGRERKHKLVPPVAYYVDCDATFSIIGFRDLLLHMLTRVEESSAHPAHTFAPGGVAKRWRSIAVRRSRESSVGLEALAAQAVEDCFARLRVGRPESSLQLADMLEDVARMQPSDDAAALHSDGTSPNGAALPPTAPAHAAPGDTGLDAMMHSLAWLTEDPEGSAGVHTVSPERAASPPAPAIVCIDSIGAFWFQDRAWRTSRASGEISMRIAAACKAISAHSGAPFTRSGRSDVPGMPELQPAYVPILWSRPLLFGALPRDVSTRSVRLPGGAAAAKLLLSRQPAALLLAEGDSEAATTKGVRTYLHASVAGVVSATLWMLESV